MARPKLPVHQKRPEIKIYPTPQVLAWVDERTGPGRRFYNRTHAFEFAVSRLIESDADLSKTK